MSTAAQEPNLQPLRVIIVGMGGRASIYSAVALTNPELLRIVGVVDVNPERVRQAQLMFDLPDAHCFATVEELVADIMAGRITDGKTQTAILKAHYLLNK